MYNISQRIKNRRIELRMSQQELADKLGYTSRSSITKIEKGTNDIPRTKIIEIASALKTTPSYLMGWDNGIRVFPNNLKQLMLEKGVDLQCLSNVTKIKLDALKKFLEDTQDPTTNELYEISKYFGVKMTDMLEKELFADYMLSHDSTEDKEIKMLLSSLNEDGKVKVLEYIKDLSDRYRNE